MSSILYHTKYSLGTENKPNSNTILSSLQKYTTFSELHTYYQGSHMKAAMHVARIEDICKFVQILVGNVE
jgi:hypothetical protein